MSKTSWVCLLPYCDTSDLQNNDGKIPEDRLAAGEGDSHRPPTCTYCK